MGCFTSVTIDAFITELLEREVAQAVLVPTRQPYGGAVMQSLVRSPAEAAAADPLAPVVPTSSATLLARITRDATEGKIAAFLRPCEVRAFIELAKLEQANLERALLIGLDCYGRFETADYSALVAEGDRTGRDLLRAVARGEDLGPDLATTCRACETPVAEAVDLRLALIGGDLGDEVGLEAVSDLGASTLEALGLPDQGAPAGRQDAIDALLKQRQDFKTQLRAEYREKVKDIDGVMELLSQCINCYNCRGVCPVCYCRQCVFTSDTFSHDSHQYLAWAGKRGSLRMPTDTLMYHLTRMAHMSTLCVRCGQCSSACPNDIPVAEIFAMVGEGAQEVFGYAPGADPEQAQPLASFFAEELPEVTGQVK